MIKKITLHIKNNIKTPLQRRIFVALCIVIVILLIVAVLRSSAYIKLRHQTNQQAVSVVSTVKVKRGPSQEDIVLPGNVGAWHEARLFARTNGYVKQWLVDIGDHVKAGDLLAVIESPEVDAQLRQTEADLKTAEANSNLAQITAKRWLWLLKTDSVSKQESDEKVSSAQALAAIVVATRATRDRLRDLVSFERITAPFDGVITSRTTDVGSLINAGSNTMPALFRIAQSNPLRIYVRVPQNYAARIQPDMKVTLHFNDRPGKSFPAKLFQTAEAIDLATRTLLVQFTAENPNEELLPGGYTQVHLNLVMPSNMVRLPANTLMFRSEGLQVATVDEGGKVVLKPITINRDFGEEVEISSGVNTGEEVILNPPDSLLSGQKVRVADPKKDKEIV